MLKLKFWQKDKPKRETKINTTAVYCDALGNTWYMYDNIGEMPITRKIDVEVAQKFAALSLGRNELAEGLELILDYSSRAQNKKALEIAFKLKERLEFAAEERTLRAYACQLFLLNDEDPTKPTTAHYNDAKNAAFDKDEECRDFFLREVYRLLPTYRHELSVTIPNYLRSIAPEAERLISIL